MSRKNRNRHGGGRPNPISTPVTTVLAQPRTDAPAAPSSPTAHTGIRRNPDQRRAAFALARVRAHLAADYGNYRAHARGLPATIVSSGLGHALAMELARAEKMPGRKLLFADVAAWLLEEWPLSPYHGHSDVLEAIAAGSEPHYVRAQVEVMALVRWLKLFAEAHMKTADD